MTVIAKTKPVVRNAQAQDIPQITGIYQDAVLYGKASFEIEPPDEAGMRRRFDNLVNNSFPYLVAQVSDLIAGYAYAGPYRARPGYRWSVESTVYVNPDFHRMGIGTLLLEQLIKICTEKNFRLMIAIIGDSDNASSIRLHEKAGFTHVGTFLGIGRKHETWLDSVLMQRQLGAGRSTPPG